MIFVLSAILGARLLYHIFELVFKRIILERLFSAGRFSAHEPADVNQTIQIIF
nr:hypothetical protein [Acinetobacter sp. RF14B]